MSTTFAFFSDTFLAFSSLNLLQPPPQGDGERGNYPPPRGYEGQPPHPHYGYGPPPPGYPPYPMAPYMYPPYGQHPMYGGPHHPPPHYPYGPEHGRGPYGPPDQDYSTRDPSRGESRRGEDKANGGGSTYDDSASSHQGEDESEAGGENSAVSARLKTYIKPRIPSTQEVLDRRSRKNAQSRARAGKLRGRIGIIEKKPPEERTEEERHIWAQYEARRRRKNDRSRERALEKKEEIDRILAKPEKKRTKIEKQFLETALSAKKRKNEGDRLRRQRLKELGLSTKGTGVKPGVSARGPLPPQYQGGPPPGYHMPPPPGDIPMSPLPSVPPHHYGHPYQQSPGQFGSPGMMNMGFSPRRQGTPGRHEPPMPYMPGPQYEGQSPGPRTHMPPSSRVEQRRNPDGSMSISIGGGAPPQDGDDEAANEEANMMMEPQEDEGEAADVSVKGEE